MPLMMMNLQIKLWRDMDEERRFCRMNETRLNRSMVGVRIIQSRLPVYGFM